jgi:NAD dependent epimerase/dehydratase family enzyme
LPNIPAFLLKLALGEMASMILANQNISSKKIVKAGYTFVFNQVEEAITDVII